MAPKSNEKKQTKQEGSSMLSGTPGLIFGAAGIYAAFLYYGNLQEDVFAYEDSKGQKFKQAWLLQTIEALANVAVGFVGMMLTGRTAGLPYELFGLSGATQVASKAFTSMGLAQGLSFPVATLAKSAKMAPVMAGSILLGGKKYSLRSYLQVGAIISFIVIVLMNKKSKPGQTSSTLGIIFVCLSLVCDGLTGGVQDKMKKKLKDQGKKAKPYDMMFFTNFFMMLVGAIVAVALGEVEPGMAYILANPSLMTKVVAFGACSAIGQSFIFFVVAEYGPLKNATVTTTRKIFSVLLSIFLKGHALAPMGWAGIGLGSLGIIGELIPEKEEENKNNGSKKDNKENSDKKDTKKSK
jgi:UDP-galactose transporter B1